MLIFLEHFVMSYCWSGKMEHINSLYVAIGFTISAKIVLFVSKFYKFLKPIPGMFVLIWMYFSWWFQIWWFQIWSPNAQFVIFLEHFFVFDMSSAHACHVERINTFRLLIFTEHKSYCVLPKSSMFKFINCACMSPITLPILGMFVLIWFHFSRPFQIWLTKLNKVDIFF